MSQNIFKIFSVLSVLFLSLSLKAESLTCEVNEFFNGESIKQNITIDSSNDSHGGWYTLANKHFTEVTGFISLLKKDAHFFTVASLYSEALKINSSGQFQMVADGQYAQHQLIIPSSNQTLDGISILCRFNITN